MNILVAGNELTSAGKFNGLAILIIFVPAFVFVYMEN